MDNEAKIRLMLGQWFVDQNIPGRSPEEIIKAAKICLLLDVAQVFLGYDDDGMAKVDDDDIVRSACEVFIKELEAIKAERNKLVTIKFKEAQDE